jgi:catechol 2,3-dioxygenase-like lactoylglutathione lyase family enzyme
MLRIRQIVFVVRDLAAGSRRLTELLALDPPFRDPGVAEFGIDNAVFAFGDQFIELVSPVRAGTAAGRHLDRRGEGGYMLILQTDAFDDVQARMRALGVRTVWEKTLPDIRAMHLHPKDIGGAIVSIDQPVPPASWRWGGPSWRMQAGARGRQRVVGVTVAAADPPAMAARWAEVLGRPVATPHGNGMRVGLDGGVVDFIGARQAGEGITGFVLRVADEATVWSTASAAADTPSNSIEAFGARIALESL